MKRTLESYFSQSTASKKHRVFEPTLSPLPHTDAVVANVEDEAADTGPPSTHATYPYPIPQLPESLRTSLNQLSLTSAAAATTASRAINDQPALDLLYFEPFVPRDAHAALFRFLRAVLPFYRVEYTIQRPGGGGGGGGANGTQPVAAAAPTLVRTPRFTSVFGVDVTSRFATLADNGAKVLVDAATGAPVPLARYRCKPRPIPGCLDTLRQAVEVATNQRFNFCLVNYYASGADGIAYHSDDEAFLGPNPTIASLSLGARRDFLMKHKASAGPAGDQPLRGGVNSNSGGSGPVRSRAIPTLKLALGSGDMVVMRGPTQAHWLHSIPKRKTPAKLTSSSSSRKGEEEGAGYGALGEGGGRINITFRNALVRGGTENYYRYNVGTGPVYRWDAQAGEMRQWSADSRIVSKHEGNSNAG